MTDREYDTSIAGLDMNGFGPEANPYGHEDCHMSDTKKNTSEIAHNGIGLPTRRTHPATPGEYRYAPLLNDADVIAAVRGAADESAADSTRIGAPGSEIREKYATRAAMLYAAAARLDALLKAAKEAAND